MNTENRREYTAGGHRFVECKLCGARFNAGRGLNSTGRRYVYGRRLEWWAKHTGQQLEGWAEQLYNNIPKCPKLFDERG